MIIVKRGDKFNMLTVLKEVPWKNKDSRRKKGRRRFECVCVCGKIKEVDLGHMRSGNVKSCGCLNKKVVKEKNTIHGMTKTKVYNVWYNLKRRCKNKLHSGYKNYGGRGITYDPKRESFQGFREDMQKGYSDNLTIDRIDNNGNYCKENCRRATKKQQARNKRNSVFYKGKTLGEWAEVSGIGYKTLFKRVNYLGLTIDEAIIKNI